MQPLTLFINTKEQNGFCTVMSLLANSNTGTGGCLQPAPTNWGGGEVKSLALSNVRKDPGYGSLPQIWGRNSAGQNYAEKEANRNTTPLEQVKIGIILLMKSIAVLCF